MKLNLPVRSKIAGSKLTLGSNRQLKYSNTIEIKRVNNEGLST
jgi:hypothetical protein